MSVISSFLWFSHGSLTSVAYEVTLRGGTRIDVIFYAGGTSILGINQQTMIFPTFGTEIKINKMLARPGIEPVTLTYQKMRRHSTD